MHSYFQMRPTWLQSFISCHFRYPIRMGLIYFLSILLIVSATVFTRAEITRPNIVFIIGDDLGWDDVSFHGSNQSLTPNIDLLAYSGVALSRYYSHSVCTPTRSALLTGKFAYTIGMHGYPLTNGEDRGLPLSEKLLPQYLKELGYATHLVGKWHVGQSRTAYMPTNRGFDTYFGHKGGFIDYYEYVNEETWSSGKVSGLDLFRNMSSAWDVEGYITDVYTDEAKSIIRSHDASSPLFLMVAHNAVHESNPGARLQAPSEIIRKMRYIESPARRIFAAMTKKLDDSVGDIVEALSEKKILDNTIIVFIADNGGMTSGNFASNWPMRGTKFSPFEGGVRVAGLMWTPTLSVSKHVWDGYMHVVDWLPTLLRAVGAEPPTEIDGVDQWQSIVKNKDSIREEIFEIDDYIGYISIISGEYKLVTGNVVKNYSGYLGGDLRGVIGKEPSYADDIKKCKVYTILNSASTPFAIDEINVRNQIHIDCNTNDSDEESMCYPGNGTMCLYNIKEDPCETHDLYETHPEIVATMLARLEIEKKRTRNRNPVFRDPRANPNLHNYTWAVWADNIDL